jgi:alpha-D-ribose 1-methylphosphonate 5-triphosphate synthase subunit PhnH
MRHSEVDFWANWLEAARFACEAHGVISARLMLFASGNPAAPDEATRMICEKVTAFAEARLAAERALADGLGIYDAAARAYAPLRQCVHANSDRLLHAAQ